MQDSVPLLVQAIVGEFQSVKGHRTLHPVLTRRRGLWMSTRLALYMTLGFPSNLPAVACPLVTTVVQWLDVHDQSVLFTRLQPGYTKAAVGEHPAALFSQNHLCPASVELVPHAVVVQRHSDASTDAVRCQVL